MSNQKIRGTQQVLGGSVGPAELASTAVTPDTYGDATHVAQVTVDQDGRITLAAEVPITGTPPADGDKGDITVSGSGTVWTIDNGVVTFAKMQAITDGKLLGASGGTAVEEITPGMGLALASNTLKAQQTWDFNFTSDGDGYIRAYEAMTIALGGNIGTGSLAYEKSTNATPGTFASTSLPATLESGAFLKVTASGVSGFLAVQLLRTA